MDTAILFIGFVLIVLFIAMLLFAVILAERKRVDDVVTDLRMRISENTNNIEQAKEGIRETAQALVDTIQLMIDTDDTDTATEESQE